MSQIAVGVLRGGPSSEYEVSLNSGKEVLASLPRDKYVTRDILITDKGEWHMNGFPASPLSISKRVDVFFNALHGTYGEDGQVQRELESYNIPYTGSRAFASSVGMNKGLAKYSFETQGLLSPRGITVRQGDDAEKCAYDIYQKFSNPYVVKPLSGGSSVGVVLAYSTVELQKILSAMLADGDVLVEEFIKGREVTCGVIEGLDGADPYPTHLVEIVKPEGFGVWSFDDKYGGKTQEVCPANIEEERTDKIKEMAVRAHKAIGMRHYSRSDFIISPHGIYILEINSLPGLTKESLLPKALATGGFDMPDFLDYVITLAMQKK